MREVACWPTLAFRWNSFGTVGSKMSKVKCRRWTVLSCRSVRIVAEYDPSTTKKNKTKSKSEYSISASADYCGNPRKKRSISTTSAAERINDVERLHARLDKEHHGVTAPRIPFRGLALGRHVAREIGYLCREVRVLVVIWPNEKGRDVRVLQRLCERYGTCVARHVCNDGALVFKIGGWSTMRAFATSVLMVS